MEVHDRAVGELRPYPGNPRINDGAVAAVAASIEEFGFRVPIVVDRDGVVVCGHTRLKAAQRLGLAAVPVTVADDLTPEQARAFRLADNKAGELAEWDMPLLEVELSGCGGLDMGAFGFDFGGMGLDMGFDVGGDGDGDGGFSWMDERGKYMEGRGMDNFMRERFFGAGAWGIPKTEAGKGAPEGVRWVSFGEKNTIEDPAATALHFFIDDYKFEAVWASPAKWVKLFRECAAVAAPDFSCYADMPPAQQVWNHYRRQWLARYWQGEGVNVISSLSWPAGRLRAWHLDGIAKGSACAASFSCAKGGAGFDAAIGELEKAVKRIRPCKLYVKCGDDDEAALREAVEFERIGVYSSRRKRGA